MRNEVVKRRNEPFGFLRIYKELSLMSVSFYLSNHFLNTGAFSRLISTSNFQGAFNETVSFEFS